MEYHNYRSFMHEEQHDKLLQCLKQCYKIRIDEKTNEPQSLNASTTDMELLYDIISEAYTLSNHLLLKEAFRCLRNSSIKNNDILDIIVSNNIKLLPISKDILIQDSFPFDLKNMVLTFLINICKHQYNAKEVWLSLDIKSLLQAQNKNLYAKICALAYNIILFGKIVPDSDFFTHVLTILQENEKEDDVNEFAYFILDWIIKSGLVFQYYDDVKIVKFRVLILQHMKELQFKKEVLDWSEDHVVVLANDFKKKSDCILKTVTDYLDKIEPYEVALLADVIASLSSDEQWKLLRNDRSLLINCAYLLKSVHDAGKQGDNHFAPVGKLSKADEIREDIKAHPAFGFRVNMIRILGNMAWKSRSNQDLLRELDVIPLLLDCCNIDGRNPFIIQWVVFAIRNICEKNTENQNVIAFMNKQGVVDSAVLQELGITLHDDGPNSINLAPLNIK